eukprot:scaffold173633_cov27-Tisochrysis_lutea.AAC.4
MYASPVSTPHRTASAVARPSPTPRSERSERTQQKKVVHLVMGKRRTHGRGALGRVRAAWGPGRAGGLTDMAVSAMLSLSKPPATERMMCAGMTAMMAAAATPALHVPVHSAVRAPSASVALTPNQAGTRQQTSLRESGARMKSGSSFQMATEVICMPG